MTGTRWRAAGLLAILLVALGGCVLEGAALDGPIAVNLHVVTTSATVEIDAPGWFADRTTAYLCHADPPLLPDPGPERVGWTPGVACHDYGTYPSDDGGLAIVLPLDALAGDAWPAFAAAPEWYLLLVEVDGERAVSAVRSRFDAPRDVVAF